METGRVTKRKASKNQVPSVQTEDAMDDIRQRINISLKKSVMKLVFQPGICVIQRINLYYTSICRIVGISRRSAPKKNVYAPLQNLSFATQNYSRWFNETLEDEDLSEYDGSFCLLNYLKNRVYGIDKVTENGNPMLKKRA